MPRVAEVVLLADVEEEVPVLLRVAEVLPLLRVAVEPDEVLPLRTVVVPDPVTVVVRVSEDPEVLTRLRTVVLPEVFPLLRVAEVVDLLEGVLAVEALLLEVDDPVVAVEPEDLVVPVVDGVLEAEVPVLLVAVEPALVADDERLAVVVLVLLEASFRTVMSRALVTLRAVEPLPVVTFALRTVKEVSGCCLS